MRRTTRMKATKRRDEDKRKKAAESHDATDSTDAAGNGASGDAGDNGDAAKKLRKQNDAKYAVTEALSHMAQNGGQTVGAILLTGFSLFVVGAAIILSLVVSGVLNGVEDQVTIRAFLDNSASEEDITAFQDSVSSYDNVASVSRTTPDEAWIEYKQMQGEERADEILAALDGNNPLPGSIVIEMNDPSQVKETAEKIRSDETFLKVVSNGASISQEIADAQAALDEATAACETAQTAYDEAAGTDGEADAQTALTDAQNKVTEAQTTLDNANDKYNGNLLDNVSYGSQTVEPLLRFINGMRIGGVAIIVLLLFFSYTFISNIIHSAIETRSDEIAIMRLVGAPNKFIRRPFMAEGMLQALIGSVIAMVALALVQTFTLPAMKNAISFVNVDIAWWQFLLLYVLLAVSGAALGMLSALLSMRKYLKI